MNESRGTPQSGGPHAAQDDDPQSGKSDDPRVDPTPDRRHTEAPAAGQQTNALGIADPTA